MTPQLISPNLLESDLHAVGENNRNPRQFHTVKKSIISNLGDDSHLKLIKRLQEEKVLRKRNEDERR